MSIAHTQSGKVAPRSIHDGVQSPRPVEARQATDSYSEGGYSYEPLVKPERNLPDYLSVVLRRKWIAGTIFLLIFFLAAAYTFTRPYLYRSVARLEIKDKKMHNVAVGVKATGFDDFQRRLFTQIGTLRSRALAESLVRDMSLKDSPEFASQPVSLTGWIKNKVFSVLPALFVSSGGSQGEMKETSKQNSLIKDVMNRVTVDWMKQSQLLEIGMEARDPVTSQLMLERYLELYVERNLEQRRKEISQALAWLEDQLAKAEKRMMASEVELIDFISKHGIISTGDGGATQVSDLVKTKMAGLHRSQESLAKFKALKGQEKIESIAMGPEFTEDSLVKKLKEDLAVLEARDAEMDALYSKNYPIRRLLRKKIQFLRKRISDLEHTAVSFALDAAKKQESLLKEAFDGAKKEASKVSGLSARYAILKKNVDTNHELHKILLKEHKEMDIRSRIALNNVMVVDPPSLPAQPVWPRKGLFLVGGLLIALLGGVVVAFVVDQLDNTVQSTELVEKEFNVPSLGVVPDITKLKKYHDLKRLDSAVEFIAYDYPKSPVSDAIRNIESSILFSSMNTGVKCVVVSSASPGEGKTFIAVSLGTLLTCGDAKRVCIVDCDLRRPRVHSVFNECLNAVGLTTLLINEHVRTKTVAKAHRIPGLFYITSGPLTTDHLPLLMSRRFEFIVEELRAEFDFVILDAPPILGFPDTRIVSRQADGVALVARQGHVSRAEYLTAAEMIASTTGGRILGVILNKARVQGAGYGYGGYYYTSSHEYYART